MKENTGLSRFQVILMAAAAGASVANIYYNQPVLKEIALSFNTTESAAGFVSMLSQIGYGLGLIFITPLGDKMNKKTLILSLMILLFFTLILMAVAGTLPEVWVLSVVTGALSVSAQVILPMAAGLDTVNRGKTLGTIFSGILIGILAARIIGGFVGEWLGWRYVYAISALFVISIVILIRVNLPDVKNDYKGNYFQILRSASGLIKKFPLLRQTSLAGGLLFGVFCSQWTTLTFHLSAPPFNLHPAAISLFGFAAFGGALVTPAFGKLADKANPTRPLLVSISMIIAGVLLIKIVPDSILVLAAGVLILNIGLPANQITNISMIYALDEGSRSRINTIYITSCFTGGALGTSVGLLCWNYGGWNWVTWQMIIWTLAATGVVLKSVKGLGNSKIGTKVLSVNRSLPLNPPIPSPSRSRFGRARQERGT